MVRTETDLERLAAALNPAQTSVLHHLEGMYFQEKIIQGENCKGKSCSDLEHFSEKQSGVLLP